MAKKSPAAPQAWEKFLELGKLEEKNGRLPQAEKAYLRALAENPTFNSLEREFARFLESGGRFKEAEERVRRALELGWPREEGELALARLRGKLTVPALVEHESYAEAAKVLEKAAAPEDPDAKWPEVFSALLCERKYREAFGLAEAMLKKSTRTPMANTFLWPWWHKVSSRSTAEKTKFCREELARLTKAARGAGFPVWFAYGRGLLLLDLGRAKEAEREYAKIVRAKSPRYAVMHQRFIMYRLLACDAKGTIAACRALLKRAPRYWWLHCRLAEAVMASGDTPGGLREFERASARAEDLTARQAVTTWHGAALLWAGEYRQALEKLDEAAALGTRNWVSCWRGAALLKLGRREKALAELDAAVAADAQDPEARLWRGEALRLEGRHSEALRDLDRALELQPGYSWAYANRALAKAALGDDSGLAADYALVPKEIAGAAAGSKEMRASLESALERAKGVRRPERYLDAVWRGRPRRKNG